MGDGAAALDLLSRIADRADGDRDPEIATDIRTTTGLALWHTGDFDRALAQASHPRAEKGLYALGSRPGRCPRHVLSLQGSRRRRAERPRRGCRPDALLASLNQPEPDLLLALHGPVSCRRLGRRCGRCGSREGSRRRSSTALECCPGSLGLRRCSRQPRSMGRRRGLPRPSRDVVTFGSPALRRRSESSNRTRPGEARLPRGSQSPRAAVVGRLSGADLAEPYPPIGHAGPGYRLHRRGPAGGCRA